MAAGRNICHYPKIAVRIKCQVIRGAESGLSAAGGKDFKVEFKRAQIIAGFENAGNMAMDVAMYIIVRMTDEDGIIKWRDFNILRTVSRCAAYEQSCFMAVGYNIGLCFELFKKLFF